MKLLMIGAGASFGARKTPDFATQPPLGTDLVQYLMSRIDEIRANPTLNQFRSSYHPQSDILDNSDLDRINDFFEQLLGEGISNYELGLSKLIEYDGSLPTLNSLNRLLSLIFTHSNMGGPKREEFEFRADLYDDLIRKLEIENGWAVISLNYDILFEEALNRQNIRWNYPHIDLGGFGTAKPSSLPVFKVHGSVNWFPVPNWKAERFEDAPTVDWIEEYSRPGNNFRRTGAFYGDEIAYSLITRNPAVPVMAHYSDKKYCPINYPLVSTIRKEALEMANSCEEAFAIGARPITEKDNDDTTVAKILGALRGTKTTFINPSADDCKKASSNFKFRIVQKDLKDWIESFRSIQQP